MNFQPIDSLKTEKKKIDLSSQRAYRSRMSWRGINPVKTTTKRLARLATLCSLGLAITIGCNAQSRHRLMNFFFEIPSVKKNSVSTNESRQTASVAAPIAFVLPPARFAVVHNPVLTRDCAACHDASNQMVPREDLTDACRTCHTEFATQEIGHAPVAGECSTCHEMHRSQIAGLLRQPILETCIECHDGPEDLTEDAHTVANVEKCTNCHDPHFGEGVLLKLGYEKYMKPIEPVETE